MPLPSDEALERMLPERQQVGRDDEAEYAKAILADDIETIERLAEAKKP
jgi:hypothetical protein